VTPANLILKKYFLFLKSRTYYCCSQGTLIQVKTGDWSMTEEKRFMFDLEGYLVVRNVLSKEEVERCNEVSNRIERDQFEVYREDGLKLARNITQWDPVVQNIIDHPKVTLPQKIAPT